MRNRITIFFILILCASNATGQGQNKPTRLRYVVVPSESVVLVAASQPDCPIEILDSKLLNAVDGSRRAGFQYVLRNRGTKPIRYVSVWALNSAATGGGPLYNGHLMDKPLMPGQKILAECNSCHGSERRRESEQQGQASAVWPHAISGQEWKSD